MLTRILVRGAAILFAAHALSPAGAAQCHQQTVINMAGDWGARFGSSADIRGNLAVIGVPVKDGNGQSGPGAVMVYQRSATGSWQLLQELTAPDAASTEFFGSQVSMGDGFVAVTAHSLTANTGGLYIFELQGGLYSFVNKFDVKDVTIIAQISDLDTSDDSVALGLPYDPFGSTIGGLVRIYDKSGGTWAPKQTLTGSAGHGAKWFGLRLDFNDDELVVLTRDNLAQVFERLASGTWQATQTVAVPTCAPFSQFASSFTDIAADGDTLAISTSPATPVLPSICDDRVEIFERAGPGAPFLATQTLPRPAGSMSVLDWGTGLTLDGTRLLSGTSIFAQGGGLSNGKPYFYERGPAGWDLTGDLQPAWPANNNMAAGRIQALSGDTVVAGAPGDNTLGPNAGSASFWSLANLGCPNFLGVPPARSIGYINQAPNYWPAGRHDLVLEAGAAHAGDLYLVLGSVSGTSPGFTVDGILIPLVPDFWTHLTFVAAGQGLLQSTIGWLDASGSALAAIQMPSGLDTGLAGITFHHAFVTFGPAPAQSVTFASSATPFTLLN